MQASDDEGLLYIGVDGGGSRCRVRVCDATGKRVGAAEGGSANVYLNFGAAIAAITQTVGQALDRAGLAAEQAARSHIGLGLAGVSSPDIAARVAERLLGFASVSVSNDAVAACIGAHAGADGGLVIAGTGSAAVMRLGGREINIGGRGFLLGDDGSGALIGRDALRKALRAYDGLESFTPLLRALMLEFSDDPVGVITWGRSATSGEFGAYAPQVLEAAGRGDTAALAILEGAGHSIAELILALKAKGAPRISLVGGLAQPLRPYLGEPALALLAPSIRDAVDGALLLAGAPLPAMGG